MNSSRSEQTSRMQRFALFATTLLFSGTSLAAVPIIQPGAPGQASKEVSAEEARSLASIQYVEADVRFMQDMIVHHWQAVDMSELADERSSNQEIRDLAGRILASQKDEIDFMQEWLRERNEAVPGRHDHHGHDHAHHDMAGMASPEKMETLADSRGNDFDRLFLQLMIEHHKGALEMVETLLRQPGSAQDMVMFEFANDVTNDQDAEIDRMTQLLAGLSTDPRVGLAAGFKDAGEAIWNMEHLANVPRPPGFYNPDNPAGLPMSRLRELAGEEPSESDEKMEGRRSLLSFVNSDIAFAGDKVIAGNYHGFNIYDMANGDTPELITSVVCPGGQGDVSVTGDFLIMSVEQPRGRLDCGLQGVAGDVSEDRFRGLRIFDISDIRRPQQVGAVQTCRGSHTHTIVSDHQDGRIIVYNSATSFVRDDEELPGCSDKPPHRDGQTALFRIDIIEIPVDDPAAARIVNSPFVFADSETGAPDGLWDGGDHGDGTQRTRATDHCHDITVFPALNIAAGACAGNGILFDITDPINPVRMDEVTDPGFAYWHSATFNNAGDKVIFTDEWGGGTRPRCRASDPLHWGANAIYDIVDGKLEFRSYYKMPAPQTEQENCVAHNGSIVPMPGRDLFVQAWYQGGISVKDFSDAGNPREIAFFDRGPIDEEELVTGGYWSAYWHQGRIYGTEMARGLDVFRLTVSDELSENELAAAKLAGDRVFNPQKQRQIDWPAEPVVARAYLDQLSRGETLKGDRLAELSGLVDRSEQALSADGNDRRLARSLRSNGRDLRREARNHEGMDRRRLEELADTLAGLSRQLR
ncbi:DUF305 domain-containing protein [Natronospira bacteriovora]|uniref:DUF305 domain-containing protein n=1 Tax=Natronospira bacteriovora TaxID=3069753 RepID=A0ABU0W9V7_9GAMM|nr:DUF305 domain-containing protein [Natronospira sp. AB-CW4]MDQ2070819.1 DUF305 domain-containing protein [Natronospira sp. AB-CW4]